MKNSAHATQDQNQYVWLQLKLKTFCRGEVGGWSSDGVELDEKQSNETRVTCVAYHLTSFAVLVSIRDQDKEPVRTART